MSNTQDYDLWRRSEILFEAALDHPPEEREAFLRRACGGNQPLKEMVQSLLVRDGEDSDFLETPLVAPRPLEAADPTADAGPTVDAAHIVDASDNEGPSVVGERWIGRRLGAYRLVRILGIGGMGQVFLGQRADGQVQQEVAIKILREEVGGRFLLRSLRQERQILARLDHPNIARSLDGGTTEEGLPYVVLEYLDGIPITAYCDSARLDVERRLALFEKICDAVDYAHRHLVVHRDLKPSNILVNEAGEPKLLDFGIAKLLDVSAGASLADRTRTQDRFLTPAYASPEQIAGEPASTASDIYSLGILLYEILTGLRPHDLEPTRPGRTPSFEIDGPPPPSTAAKVSSPTRKTAPSSAGALDRQGRQVESRDGDAPGEPRRGFGILESASRRAELRSTTPRQLRRQLKGDLDSIVRHCLQPSPEERYRSAGELAQDLRRHRSGLPVVAQAPKLAYRLGKFIRRNRIGVALAGLALIALLGLGLQIVLQSKEVARERDLAEAARAEAEEVTRFLTEAIELSDPFYRPESDLRPGDQVTVKEVLEYSALKIRDRFRSQPMLQARLMHTIGTVYGGLSRLEEAEALHLEALALRRERAADRPLELVESLNGLVFIYVESGRLEEAAPLVAEAVDLARQVGSSGATRLAESLTNAGMLGFFDGDLKAAEAHLREALELRTATLPADHQDQILNRTYLARVLTRKGTLDEAETLLREALEICLRAEGEEHARYTSVAGDLAWLLTVKGDNAAAEPYYRKSLEILERSFGSTHPRVLEARGALGLFLRETGDFAAAEAMLRSNLELRRETAGDDLDGQAAALNNLGLILMDQGRPEEAEHYFGEGLEIANASRGESRRDRHIFLRNLARALHAQGKDAEAEPLLRQALTMIEEEQGQESWRFGHGLSSLASVLTASGRAEEAAGLAQRAEKILVAALPAGHARISLARGAHGAALVELGRFDEAEPLLLESLAELEESSAKQPQTLLAARRRLVRLYEAWGRPTDADPYRSET